MKEIRTVFSIDEREEVEMLLAQHKIPYRVVENPLLYENAYTTNLTGRFYKIEVEDAVAPQALELLNSYYDAEGEENSILQEFDDDDLIEIVAYPANYAATKVTTAAVILINRGYTDERIATEIKHKTEADNQPQRVKSAAIYAGYFFALIGGILGFAIGWFLYFAKSKHTVTGQRYYAHDTYSRRQGLYIMVIGGLFWLIIYAYILL